MNDEDMRAVDIINESVRKQKAQKEQKGRMKESQNDAFKVLFNFIGGIILNIAIMIMLVSMHDRINLGITIFMIAMNTIVIIICMFNVATYSYSIGKYAYDETINDYSNVDISKAETSDSNPVIVSTENNDSTVDNKENKYYGGDDSMLIKNLSLLNDYE